MPISNIFKAFNIKDNFIYVLLKIFYLYIFILVFIFSLPIYSANSFLNSIKTFFEVSPISTVVTVSSFRVMIIRECLSIKFFFRLAFCIPIGFNPGNIAVKKNIFIVNARKFQSVLIKNNSVSDCFFGNQNSNNNCKYFYSCKENGV